MVLPHKNARVCRLWNTGAMPQKIPGLGTEPQSHPQILLKTPNSSNPDVDHPARVTSHPLGPESFPGRILARSARNPFRAVHAAESFPHSAFMTMSILHRAGRAGPRGAMPTALRGHAGGRADAPVGPSPLSPESFPGRTLARSARNPFRAASPAESFPHSAFMTTAILREKVGQVGRVPCPRLCVGMRGVGPTPPSAHLRSARNPFRAALSPARPGILSGPHPPRNPFRIRHS